MKVLHAIPLSQWEFLHYSDIICALNHGASDQLQNGDRGKSGYRYGKHRLIASVMVPDLVVEECYRSHMIGFPSKIDYLERYRDLKTPATSGISI
jgi:hypothetical protein